MNVLVNATSPVTLEAIVRVSGLEDLVVISDQGQYQSGGR